MDIKNKLTPEYKEKLYQQLLTCLPSNLTTRERSQINLAFEIAYQAHDNTFRESKKPYITHPLAVAEIVANNLGLGAISIVSALLHDVVEDTNVSLDTIREKFSEEVATIVEALTKLDVEFSWHEPKHAKFAQEFLSNIAKDRRIILIKLADRLDNMRSISALSRQKQLRIATQTMRLFVPIAHRLGLSKMKAILEDLCFKTIDSEKYYAIAEKLEKTLEEREQEVADFIQPIKREMQRHGLVFRMKTRPKSIYSIYKKMREKKIEFKDVYDLFAVRIILKSHKKDEKVHCWQTYGIVTSLYTPNTKRHKDWISTPKSNGYESLHITVMNQEKTWVEVQIRTERMNTVAGKGIASHWKYKGLDMQGSQIVKKLDSWMHNISHLAQNSDSLHALKSVEWGLTKMREIHVITEDGVTVTLPKGAILLDLAIDQQGKKGLFCSHGLANNKLVSSDYVLQEGDYMKLMKPVEEFKSPSSLAFLESLQQSVLTPKASRLIQTFFEEKRNKCVTQGEKLLKKALAKHDIPYSSRILDHLREFLDEESTTDVLLRIATSRKNLASIAKNFAKSIQENSIVEEPELKSHKIFSISKKNQDKYELAECCKPLPGEATFGIIVGKDKIRLHTVFCEKGEKILVRYGGRIIATQWYNTDKVRVQIIAYFADETNMRNNIMAAIKTFDVQSLLINKKTKHGQEGYVDINVAIKDVSELVMLEKKLKALQGIREIITNKYPKRQASAS